MLCTTSQDHSRATEAYLSAAKAEPHEPPQGLPKQVLTDELASEMTQQHLLVLNHNMQTPLQQRYVSGPLSRMAKGML